MQIHIDRRVLLTSVLLTAALASIPIFPQAAPPAPVVINTGWQLQDVAKVPEAGAEVSSAAFKTAGWYTATVPGTVLTTLVNNKVYPEPLYGENNRPENIPESLVHTSYWYRTQMDIPKTYHGQRIWG